MTEQPKSIRAIRRLRKKEPKLIQGPKKTLFLRGNKSSQTTMSLIKDLRSLRREHCTMYSRKHDIHPLENRPQLEALCKKADASLFMFCSHNKKRPNNVVIGRTYEHKVLDMVQMGLLDATSIQDVVGSLQVPFSAHPFLVFQGDLWESEQDFKKLKNLINDFFVMNHRPKGLEIDKALKVVVCWSVTEDKKIFLNIFQVAVEGGSSILQEEGKLVIEEMGPNASFVLRRHSWATDEEFKKATHVPKLKKKKQNKNIKYDKVGNKRGKLYLDRQNLKNMPSKRRRMISKGDKPERKQIARNPKHEDEFAQ